MNTSNQSPNLDPVAIHDRVTAAVRSQATKTRILTSIAFLFGFLAVTASVLFVCAYLVLYLPKQKQILRNAEAVAQSARPVAGGKEESVPEAIKRIDQFLGVEIILTHVVSMGMTAIAIMVGVLALGTLVLLTIVVLNRRATLHQINVSLAQISSQLRELQAARSPSAV